MKIRISKIIHGVEGEAPFKGVILHSNTKDKKGTPYKLKEIFQEITEDGINEGIIFTGDWEKQPKQFLAMLKKVKGYGLRVSIYTEKSFYEFTQEIGITAWEKTYKTKLKREKNPLDNDPMLAFMGGAILDLYLGHMDFQISTVENGKKVLNNIQKNDGVVEEIVVG